MALSINWNDTYESTPTKGLNRSALDNEFRKLKRAIREVMEREHNWGPYTDKDDGTHIPGKVRVLLRDDASTRDGLSNVEEGALYLLDTGEHLELQLYIDGSWQTISPTDHGELLNLISNDGHSQFVRKDDFTMSGNLNLDGNALLVESDSDGKENGFATGVHYNDGHTLIGSADAVEDGIANATSLKIGSEKISGSSSGAKDWPSPDTDPKSGEKNNHYANIDIPAYTFFPNFHAENNADLVIVCGSKIHSTSGLGISLFSESSFDYNVNIKFLES